MAKPMSFSVVRAVISSWQEEGVKTASRTVSASHRLSLNTIVRIESASCAKFVGMSGVRVTSMDILGCIKGEDLAVTLRSMASN